MKSLLTGLFVIASTCQAYAAVQGSIAPCFKDKITAARIDEVPQEMRIGVRNPRGEEVGALVFADRRGTKLDSMYLCGNNSNYFYVKADAKDWVGQPRVKKSIGMIYNDEYEATTTAQTLGKNAFRADLVMTIYIVFTGAPEDADYTQAAGDVLFTLPLDR